MNNRTYWYLWNLCYDLNSGKLSKSFSITIQPGKRIGSFLVWFADKYLQLTDEELRELDREDGISDEGFSNLFRCAVNSDDVSPFYVKQYISDETETYQNTINKDFDL